MSGSFGSLLPMLAIVVVVALAAAIAGVYLVRRFGIGSRSEGVARGRQSRLALVDAAPIIDGRKLVIVRRDNVEHLLLIGGATDVLIEPNIIRPAASHAMAAPGREVHARAPEPEVPVRPAAPELTTSPSVSAAQEISMPDATRWPLQPEVTARAVAAEPHTPETTPSPGRPAEPVRTAAQVQATPPVAEHEKEPAAIATDHFAELAAALQRPSANASETKPAPTRASTPATATNDDPNLTDMAHRLEAALRRPLSPSGTTPPQSKAEPRRPGPMPPPAQRATPAVDAPRLPPRLVPEPRLAPEPRLTPEPKVAPEPRVVPEPSLAPEPKADGAPSDEKPAFESLEREMASLLGRPPR